MFLTELDNGLWKKCDEKYKVLAIISDVNSRECEREIRKINARNLCEQ